MKLAAVLCSIRSVHNTGSIFRTADGAGFEKIYVCGITPTPLDRFGRVRRDFAKVSLGAEKYLEWEYRKSAAAVLKELKRDGWTVLALEQAKNSLPLGKYELPRGRKAALVIGSETTGIPPFILALSDRVLEIPMRGKKESLNAGVAFGIAAYRLAGLGGSS